MNNSIYISNKQIEVINFSKEPNRKVKVLAYESIDLPEQVILNGVVMDASAVVGQLKALYTKKPGMFKNASLTIDTNAILTKKVPVPPLKDWQLRNVAREELTSSSGIYEKLIFDYSLMSEGKDKFILACAVNRPIVDDFVSIFKEAGITLSAIYIGIDLVIQYVRSNAELCKEAIAINIVDDVSMLSLIFEEGRYMFSTRTRIISETDDQKAFEMLQNLNSLVQFYKNVKKSYYIGLHEELIETMTHLRPEHVEVDLLPYNLLHSEGNNYDPNGLIGDNLLHFSFLGALATKQNINLLSTVKASTKKVKDKPFNPLVVILPLLFIVPSVALYMFYHKENNVLKDRIAVAEAYLNNQQNIDNRNSVLEFEDESKYYQAIVDEIRFVDMNVEVVPKFATDVYNKLMTACGDKVRIDTIEFSLSAATLTLNCVAATQHDASAFMNRISQDPVYADVTYKGYAQISESNEGYGFTIVAKYNVETEAAE